MQRALAGHPPPQDAVTRRVLQAALGRGSEARCDAVVVSGWLVRGDSWVESPPRAGYPLDDVACVTARRNPEAQRKGPLRCCRAFLKFRRRGKCYSAFLKASPSGLPSPVHGSQPAFALYAPLSPCTMSRNPLPAPSA